MSKNLFIFDLDGVLIDTKELHYESLNKAISEFDKSCIISREDQKNIYEGIPTKSKLDLLSLHKGLDKGLHDNIYSKKQSITFNLLQQTKQDDNLIQMFLRIKEKGINIAVASNSIRKTVELVLTKLGLIDIVDYYIANDDVNNPKPHPEMYWIAMSTFGVVPENTVIFEDSVVGKVAALNSNAHLIEIENRIDLNDSKIDKGISLLLSSKPPFYGSDLNVVIPMAGLGSRFADAGYSFPKPLIDVNNKPMIQSVVDSLGIVANYIYIVQQEHYDKYNLQEILERITPNCRIIKIDGLTEGAAVTVLKAKSFIDNDSQLILANSDQIIDWDSRDFMYQMHTKNLDAGIVTFESSHPKWSYARVDENGLVNEVAEKRPISNLATVGVYYWKKGSDFVKYAEQMIAANKRVNNEFYVCPVFNEAISDKKRIETFDVNKMYGIGTPEDLERYLNKND